MTDATTRPVTMSNTFVHIANGEAAPSQGAPLTARPLPVAPGLECYFLNASFTALVCCLPLPGLKVTLTDVLSLPAFFCFNVIVSFS